MVEVIVTAVIFVLATAGILSTVSMIKPQGTESSKKIEAAYVGKGVIDQLRKEVDASTWNTGALKVGGPYNWGGPTGDYTVSYTVTETDPTFRKLTMTITWPDP